MNDSTLIGSIVSRRDKSGKKRLIRPHLATILGFERPLEPLMIDDVFMRGGLQKVTGITLYTNKRIPKPITQNRALNIGGWKSADGGVWPEDYHFGIDPKLLLLYDKELRAHFLKQKLCADLFKRYGVIRFWRSMIHDKHALHIIISSEV